MAWELPMVPQGKHEENVRGGGGSAGCPHRQHGERREEQERWSRLWHDHWRNKKPAF